LSLAGFQKFSKIYVQPKRSRRHGGDVKQVLTEDPQILSATLQNLATRTT